MQIKKQKKHKNLINKKGYVSTLAGTNSNCNPIDGNLNIALFSGIQDLYFDSIYNQILISDSGNNRVKVLDFASKYRLNFNKPNQQAKTKKNSKSKKKTTPFPR